MLLIQRKSDKRTLLLSKNSAFPNGEDPQWMFDNNIKPHHPELVSLADVLVYRLHDINDKTEILAILQAGKREIQIDAEGNVISCLTWPMVAIAITGLMQFTVSNGGIQEELLNLPLADRQISIATDPVYDTPIEISIIRNDTTGVMDIAYCTNSAPIAAGWSIVQTILSGIIPAGTIDLNTLGLI